MKSFAVLFVFACIAGSFGKPVADDDRCQGPDQLHGRMVVVADSGVITEMNFQADNHQKAQRYTSHTHNMEFDTILLYQTGKQYTLVNDGKNCYVNNIDQEYHPLALPANYHLMGEGELAGELEIQAYGFKDNESAVMVLMAQESCTPAVVIAKAAGHTSVTTFLDTAIGVDADAFTIPAVCANASVRRSMAQKRGMVWGIPSSKRDQFWFKL